MKIISLEAENYKRLKAVEITPEGNLVVIGGRNAQGKSSVLDAIWAALGGREGNKAAKPIRDGESKARVRLDLGDLVVTRTWTESGSTVKVESAEGAVFKSPQSMLDELIGRLSFDPLAFTRLSGKEQRDVLLGLVDLPIDLDALGAERERLFSDRTEVGREGKSIGDVQVDKSLPEVETSATDLIVKIREGQESLREAASHADQIAMVAAHLEAAEKQVAELRATAAALADRNVPAVTAEQVANLEMQLSGVEESNAAIRANNAARAQAERKDILRKKYDALTADIAALDAKKQEALGAVAFPVDGLGFDENGVAFNGVPFSQASSAEQIRVSIAMAISGNPKLRVMRIMDGSLLDEENLALVAESAEANDMQVWVERVGRGDGMGVVIEDGEVIE
ncbi:MAG: AAA family ATPase [Rhodoferax sp.]|nr:AAA family ATPase [Rhodoferax sp.]